MADLIDWSDTEWTDVEILDIGAFDVVIQKMSAWMDEELEPLTVVGILRQVVWADLEVPVVVSSKGEILKGLPQLLRAYIEGNETVPTVRLPGCAPSYRQ
tara:strand:+ start:207 stop:506 length:300 start_codon:yes stop_codon:yes gene_type:complete